MLHSIFNEIRFVRKITVFKILQVPEIEFFNLFFITHSIRVLYTKILN